VIGIVKVEKEPNDVALPQGTGKAYVTNEGSNSVSVIDKRSLTVIATIPTGPRPHHITASPNGKLVYFGEWGTNKVGVIDTQTDKLVAEYTASADTKARSHAVFPTPDGKMLLVANTATNDAAALDAATGTILWNMRVSDNFNAPGNNPSEVVPDNTGKLAYATLRADNKLIVIDLERRAIVGEVEVGVEPDTIHLTPNGKTLVIGLRGKPASIAIVDADTLTVKSVNLPGSTTGHNQGSANGRYAFVAIESSSTSVAGVAVVDLRDNRLVTFYPYPGGGRPHGMDWESEQLPR
jgi:YVTN family beta-propeller protein